MKNLKLPYVFFGSAEFSLYVLDELEKAAMPPSLIVTAPDKPSGRGLTLTPTGVKIWGNKRGIPVLDPARLDADFIKNIREKIDAEIPDGQIPCFIVAAYGKIIPQTVLDLPPCGTLNVHPSLLPRYRGATPLQSAMLDDVKKTGVTVMRIDAALDHGPIVAQKAIMVDEWPVYEVFEETMAREGGRLLADIFPGWRDGKIAEKEQDHADATFTKKITKEDGLIDLAEISAGNPAALPRDVQYAVFRKIQAYHQWPTAYFFISKTALDRKIRIKITKASWRDDALVIEKVIPEGKKETDFKNLFV